MIDQYEKAEYIPHLSDGLQALLDKIKETAMSPTQISMRLDLMGETATDDFVYELLGELPYSEITASIAIGCIRRGMFLDNLKNWNVFMVVLANMVDYHPFAQSAAFLIFREISRRRPGIVIGHYLKHGTREFHNNPKFTSLFDNEARKLSERLSKMDENYRNTCHKKVMDIFNQNVNFESVMS